MQQSDNWWEDIFSGSLEVGINKDKLAEVEEESFLYFDENPFLQDNQL